MGKPRNSQPVTPPAAPIAPEVTPVPALFGTSKFASTVLMGGKEHQLGDAVRAAFEASGLEIDAWNGLPEDDRDARIGAVVDPAADVDTAVVGAVDASTLEQELEELGLTVEEDGNVSLELTVSISGPDHNLVPGDPYRCSPEEAVRFARAEFALPGTPAQG